MACLSLFIAIVLWCLTNARAAQSAITIEDNSGPWILVAAVVSAVSVIAAPLIVRARRK